MILTDLQYKALQNLYNEFTEAFRELPQEYQNAYWARVYKK